LGVLGVLVIGLSVTAAVSGHARTDPHPVLAEASIAVHLLSVGCWVGGLAALVLLGGLGWRTVPPERRSGLVRELVPRFSRVAMVAVVVVIASGTLNAITAMAGVSDLWRTEYGKVVSAKVVLLVLALVLAARHLRVTPRHLAGDDDVRAVRSFARTSALELVLLAVAVALASALVALVPGRSLALAEKGAVSVERGIGADTVQLFIDPTAVGANQVHVTFVNPSGLAAAEVTNVTVAVTPPVGSARAVAMRLIAPGHFAGDTTFSRPGKYRLSVSTTAAGKRVSTTFTFTISRRA
jgi:copper transport protein